MLLRKTVKDEVVKGVYKSSNILISEYDQTNNDLTVVFKNGGKYTYNNVAITDYTRFELADSQGKVLNSHIKKYSFINHGKIDTKTINEEIEVIEKEDLRDYAENVKDHALELIVEIDGDLELSNKIMDNMIAAIETYKAKRDGK